MLPSTKAYPRTLVPSMIVELYILHPGPMTQLAPITTLGPSKAEASTCAEGSIRTSPVIEGPLANLSGFFSLAD